VHMKEDTLYIHVVDVWIVLDDTDWSNIFAHLTLVIWSSRFFFNLKFRPFPFERFSGFIVECCYNTYNYELPSLFTILQNKNRIYMSVYTQNYTPNTATLSKWILHRIFIT